MENDGPKLESERTFKLEELSPVELAEANKLAAEKLAIELEANDQSQGEGSFWVVLASGKKVTVPYFFSFGFQENTSRIGE